MCKQKFLVSVVFLGVCAVFVLSENLFPDSLKKIQKDWGDVVCKPICNTVCERPPELKCEEVYIKKCRRCKPEFVRVECPPPPEIKCSTECSIRCMNSSGEDITEEYLRDKKYKSEGEYK